ncbi:cysteine proteinase [Cadophora sp. DSE1049]|nr:cysteine proteinase [Cadophora sp. DSE1049]
MGKKYIMSPVRPSPKFTKISKFSLPPKAQKFKHRRTLHSKVFDPSFKRSIYFKNTHKPLPIRSRSFIIMPVKTRSKAAGPKSIDSSAPRAKAPSVDLKVSATKLEESKTSGSTSPKRSRTEATESDANNYNKRVKRETESSESPDDLLTTEPTKPTGGSCKKNLENAEELKNEEDAQAGNDFKNGDTLKDEKDLKDAKDLRNGEDVKNGEDSRNGKDQKGQKASKKPGKKSRKIRRDWDRLPAASQQGFVNLTGSICYRSGGIQALLHIPAFANWIMDALKPENCVADEKENCVSCILHRLTSEYWAGTSIIKTWKRLHTVLKRKGWGADVGNGHADAGEQLIWILSQIEKEVPAKVYSGLQRLFCIKTDQVIECSGCGYKATSDPGYQHILNLPLQKNATLTGHIEKYLAAEKLTDYKCDSCHKIVANSKYFELVRLPEVLCVQINRIQYRNGRQSINHALVNIPTTLDLTKFHPTSTQDGKQHPKIEYELLSVVKHHGGVKSGHYVCAAVGGDGVWKLYDDSSVKNSSAAAATGKANGFDPFMMFYQRRRA